MPDRPPPTKPRFALPENELVVRATRSGGPGGQHVNTSSTRVEVRWNVPASAALSEDQRARVAGKLARRIDREGWVRVVESGSRSQHRNREVAVERLEALVAGALTVPKPRRATRVPKAEKARRLEAKRRRAAQKRTRRPVRDDE